MVICGAAATPMYFLRTKDHRLIFRKNGCMQMVNQPRTPISAQGQGCDFRSSMYHAKSCCVVRGIQHFRDKNFKRIGVHGWASLIKEIRGRVCQNDSSARAKFTTRLSRPGPCPPTLFICGRRARAACHMPIFPRKKVQIKHVCVLNCSLARRFASKLSGVMERVDCLQLLVQSMKEKMFTLNLSRCNLKSRTTRTAAFFRH